MKTPIFCIECAGKSIIKTAVKLVPVREGHYDIDHNTSTIDNRKEALCRECYEKKNDFQKSNCEKISDKKPILNKTSKE